MSFDYFFYDKTGNQQYISNLEKHDKKLSKHTKVLVLKVNIVDQYVVTWNKYILIFSAK